MLVFWLLNEAGGGRGGIVSMLTIDHTPNTRPQKYVGKGEGERPRAEPSFWEVVMGASCTLVSCSEVA